MNSSNFCELTEICDVIIECGHCVITERPAHSVLMTLRLNEICAVIKYLHTHEICDVIELVNSQTFVKSSWSVDTVRSQSGLRPPILLMMLRLNEMCEVIELANARDV